MRTGAGTAEASRAVLHRVVQEYPVPGGKRKMNIKTVALWDSWRPQSREIQPIFKIF